MTPLEIVNLPGVAARNATSALTAAGLVQAVLDMELAARNRSIVIDTARRRLRVLAGAPVAVVAPEPVAEVVAAPVVEPEPASEPETTTAPLALTEPDDSATATCPRCRVPQPVTAFGWRTMQTKRGPVIRRQSQCRKCRGMPAVQPRAPKAVVAESAEGAPL